MYETRVVQRDEQFLDAHKFLFYRFRLPWYGLVLLIRNLLLALTPVLRDDSAQVRKLRGGFC